MAGMDCPYLTEATESDPPVPPCLSSRRPA